MLTSEFEQEWSKLSAANINRTIPPVLDPVESEYIMQFYCRDDFDATCSGPDRHGAFTRWARANYDMLSRDVETAKAVMMQALRNKAMVRAVRT